MSIHIIPVNKLSAKALKGVIEVELIMVLLKLPWKQNSNR
jgi:hypothetical protein